MSTAEIMAELPRLTEQERAEILDRLCDLKGRASPIESAAPPLPARWLLGIEVPLALGDVADAIERSRYILSLPDDWDEEGSPAYALESWERAARFALRIAVELWRSERVRVAPPAIRHGPAGSIDIHWKAAGAEMLINVPPAVAHPATFYGVRSATGAETKGTLDPSVANEWLLMWLAAK